MSDAEIVAVEGVGVIEAEKMDEKTAETVCII